MLMFYILCNVLPLIRVCSLIEEEGERKKDSSTYNLYNDTLCECFITMESKG